MRTILACLLTLTGGSAIAQSQAEIDAALRSLARRNQVDAAVQKDAYIYQNGSNSTDDLIAASILNGMAQGLNSPNAAPQIDPNIIGNMIETNSRKYRIEKDLYDQNFGRLGR